jgi:hypothetical protein
VLDASPPASLDALRTHALELALRRGGFSTLALPADLSHDRLGRAARAVLPSVVVIAGGDLTKDQVGRLMYAIGQSAVFEYGAAMGVTEAVESIKEMLAPAVRVHA